MDKKFLNKVVDQIVYETIMDYEKGEIQFPFTVHPLSRRTVISFSSPFLPHFLFSPSLSSFFFSSFSKHCRDIYGLNDNEIEYVWKEYIQIIKDKLKNNG